MKIRLFITGGTIDVEEIKENGDYTYSETYILKMLKQGRCNADIESEILFMKDSLYITDEERDKLLQSCRNCEEDYIIITHGTDTAAVTAQVLGKNIKNKTIVLLGAMIPCNQKESDALFNLGSAVSSVQLLSKGVYICMNGKIFSWDNVRKNRELMLFETIK